MNTRFRVFASYNILQYLRDFVHVLIFATVSKCRKSPKFNEYSDLVYGTCMRTHQVHAMAGENATKLYL